MSGTAHAPTTDPAPTLELLWQDDASALALARDAAGRLTADGLDIGTPAAADLSHLGSASRHAGSRWASCSRCEPDGRTLGGSALVTLAVLDRARRSLAEGLVHPHLQSGDGRWHALWGATLDESLREELDALADAAPAVCAVPFDGDTDAFVYDLYGCAVDELARRALRRTARARGDARDGAPERFLATLHAEDSALPANAGYPALERRLSAWVDGGLDRRSRAPWNVGLRLDEHDDAAGSRVSLELWLQAADDPTLALPASLLRDGGEDVFAFLREGTRTPRSSAASRRSRRSSPTPASRPSTRTSPAVELDTDQVRAFLARAVPRLEELAVPVLLPRAWVASTSRVRVNLVATGLPDDVERAPHAGRDRVVRLAARRRRRRADGGGARGSSPRRRSR